VGFGDGSISAEPNPTHTFLDFGTYDVRLIAIGDGGRDTIYHRIEVIENPTADFELESALVKIPEEPLRLVNKSKLGDFYFGILEMATPAMHLNQNTITDGQAYMT
jgi:hypothetical protein